MTATNVEPATRRKPGRPRNPPIEVNPSQTPVGSDWLSIDGIAARYGICRTSVINLRKKPDFPKPVRIGALPRWPASEVDAWLLSTRK
jgi:predicted DNA-binding transcriptional regulator AlpA